jgi:uncharacterized protein YaiL (DUF2058 family)
MSSSLRDQLLQLGLVNKAQVNEAERQQQRRERPPPRGRRPGGTNPPQGSQSQGSAPQGSQHRGAKPQGSQPQGSAPQASRHRGAQPQRSQPRSQRGDQGRPHSPAAGQAQPQHARANPAAAAQAVQAAKVARDLAMNEKQRLKAEKRARHAEIKQLLEQHAVARPIDGEAYNFLDGTKIHQIRIDSSQRLQLARGELLVLRFDGRYHLLASAIAARIRNRDERIFVHSGAAAAAAPASAADDAYAAFVVPDDLIW